MIAAASAQPQLCCAVDITVECEKKNWNFYFGYTKISVATTRSFHTFYRQHTRSVVLRKEKNRVSSRPSTAVVTKVHPAPPPPPTHTYTHPPRYCFEIWQYDYRYKYFGVKLQLTHSRTRINYITNICTSCTSLLHVLSSTYCPGLTFSWVVHF